MPDALHSIACPDKVRTDNQNKHPAAFYVLKPTVLLWQNKADCQP